MSLVGCPFGPSQLGNRFGQTRGRIQGSFTHGVNYPNPFFDIAHTYFPASVKSLFRWCRYYFLVNPLINAVAFKLSEYPITDIIVDHESREVVKLWTDFLQNTLSYRPFQVEVGLDYNVYGNSFVSLGFPFIKYLSCKECGFSAAANKIRKHWRLTDSKFRLQCPRCHNTSDAIANDQYLTNASGLKLIRWNSEDIEISYNDVSGEYKYYYSIPDTIQNDMIIGKKEIVESLPNLFLEALRQKKGLVFSKDMLFHMKRPSLATMDRGWGTPLLLPVLKDTFYSQILRKANEAIALEHILPLRILFPQAGSGTADPYTSINLADWREHVAAEIARWRLDPNYIPLLPLPIGNQTIGGDGRALLVTPELQAINEQIVVGMGVPKEFIWGGTSYAGTNVSMRMVENMFLGYIVNHLQLLRHIVKVVASYMEWPEVNVRFKPFKMADDLQRKAYLFQLNQMQKVSDTTLLADADLDQEEENAMMVKETAMRLEATRKQQLAMADIQGEQQALMMKHQAKAQQAQMQAQTQPAAPGEPQGGSEMQSQLNVGQRGGGMDVNAMAGQWAQQLSQMDPQSQQSALQNLMSQNPELGQLVQQALSSMGGQQQVPGAPQPPQMDMRPNPQQLPPRRANAGI